MILLVCLTVGILLFWKHCHQPSRHADADEEDIVYSDEPFTGLGGGKEEIFLDDFYSTSRNLQDFLRQTSTGENY
jgi:hypothetical protein